MHPTLRLSRIPIVLVVRTFMITHGVDVPTVRSPAFAHAHTPSHEVVSISLSKKRIQRTDDLIAVDTFLYNLQSTNTHRLPFPALVPPSRLARVLRVINNMISDAYHMQREYVRTSITCFPITPLFSRDLRS